MQNHPGRSDTFQQALLGGGANQFIYDPDGYPGSANQWNIAVQHQFGNGLSVEATYIGLDGNHLANTLNYNQLGLEHVNRAATDTSVCSLTGNVIIPFGAAGYASNQRDTCYGAYLRQQVPNPARRPDSRREPVHGDGPARPAAAAVPAVPHRPISRATTATAATTRCSCAPTSASAPAASSAPTTPSRAT